MARRFLIAILLLCMVPALASTGAEIVLAEGGVARVPIVVSPRASDATRAVARELGDYLGRISGARFEVIEGDGARGIVLGTLAEFPDPALEQALAIRNRFDGLEAYAIRTEAGRLRLIGGGELGASHAAYHLLEHLGCRWFFPAPQWQIVPSAPRLSVALEVDDRPRFIARRIWYGWGFFADPPPRQSRAAEEYATWARRNRMASSLPIRAGHAWQNIIVDNRKLFEAHPEYLALSAGKRQGEQLCVTNPEVRRLAVEYALRQFEKNPEAEMVSMEASDGGGHCECEVCAKLGGASNQVFDLANHVARAVRERFPGKMIGCLAYNEHAEPPSFDLEPNVYVQLTAGFIQGRHTFDELLELWPRRCKNLGFYEYFSVWLWDFDRLPGGRGGDVDYIRKQIRRYAASNATSLDAESGNNWGPHGRGYYIANRLMWNPDADVDALLADFYDKAFGPAAPAMRRYYERVEPARFRADGAAAPGASADRIFSAHVLALAFRDIEEAGRLAADDPEVLARIDHLKQYLRFMHLCWLRDRAGDKAKKKELALAVIRHAYRTRHSYMNHWQAMVNTYVPKAAKEFDEPAWDPRDRGKPKAWMDEAPITREETEADFREGLAYFIPQAVEERAFSGDLVPARFAAGLAPGSVSAPAVSTQSYQGAARYALWSKAGEAIRVDIVPGTIAWYRNRPDARYSLVDAGGKRIAEGRLKLTGESTSLEMKVPAAGRYTFEFQDSSAGWRITVPKGEAATILLARGQGLSHQGHMQRMYFYVPRGTRRLQYFWSGGAHEVVAPDGKVAAEVKTTGEFVSIDVPPGADGRVWSLQKLALGELWFFNAPNVLAASPEALLLPRELVEADGLR